MAISSIITGTLLFFAIVAPSFAANYDLNWSAGTDYTSWASGKSITVGDTITFLYGGFHTINEVSQAEYESCSASNSLSSHGDGNTVINLDKEGTRYFICAAAGHCDSGMKIAITVATTDAVEPPAAAGASPVETPLTPPSRLSKSGGAVVSPQMRNALAAGFVLAGFVALG